VGVQPQSTVAEDVATIEYFDSHVPEYSTARLEHVARFVREHSGPDAALIDLGCGVGNTLAFMKDAGGVADVAGLDVSARCLEQTRELVGCRTYQGSVFDPAVVDQVEGKFDFAVLAAVLHHLIGRTRKESRQHAQTALENAVRLLKPGGYVIVLEPIFYPPLAMDGVFYVKKLVSKFTSGRASIGGYWNNLGAPVVSYYTNEQLEEMVSGVRGLKIVERHIDPDPLGPVVNRVLSKTNTTVIAQLES
jgi:SAM-dependent methyltransferase